MNAINDDDYTTITTGDDRFGNVNNAIRIPTGGGVKTINIPF